MKALHFVYPSQRPPTGGPHPLETALCLGSELPLGPCTLPHAHLLALGTYAVCGPQARLPRSPGRVGAPPAAAGPPARGLPRSADSTENPMIYLCPRAPAACPGCRWRRIHSAPEQRGGGGEGRERGARREREKEREQACPHPGAPSRPLSPHPHMQGSLPITASSGPSQTQLLIINNSVYLYQNHYLNWLHDTHCSLSAPQGGGAIKARFCTP